MPLAKNPLLMAMKLGIGTVLKVIIAQKISPNVLTVPFLEGRVSKLLGTPGRGVFCDSPEIATDLDRVSDFIAVGAIQK